MLKPYPIFLPYNTDAQCDIALLTVEDDEFWEGVEGLEIGGLPHMQESVVVVGVSATVLSSGSEAVAQG